MFESLLVFTLCSLLCTGLFPWINVSSLLSQLPVRQRILSLVCIRISAFSYFPACDSVTQDAVLTSGEIIYISCTDPCSVHVLMSLSRSQNLFSFITN